MKELLLWVLLSLSVLAANGQAWIGVTQHEIIRDTDKKYVMTQGELPDGDKYIRVKYEHADFLYVFLNGSDVVTFCMSYPSSIGSVNAYVESYNRQYAIIAENEWRAYLQDGSVMSIKMGVDEDKDFYFLYK